MEKGGLLDPPMDLNHVSLKLEERQDLFKIKTCLKGICKL